MCVRGVTLKLSSWDPVFELRSDIAADGRTRKRWLPESDCTADDCSNRRHLIAGVVQTFRRWHIGSFDHTHANFKNRFMCFATRFCNHMVHHVSDHQVMDNMEQNHWIKTVLCDNVVINRWYSAQKLRTFITPANTIQRQIASRDLAVSGPWDAAWWVWPDPSQNPAPPTLFVPPALGGGWRDCLPINLPFSNLKLGLYAAKKIHMSLNVSIIFIFIIFWNLKLTLYMVVFPRKLNHTV